jgi:acyl dehydratase
MILRARAKRAIKGAGLAIKEELKGKAHPPIDYEVGREKIREYAYAVGEHDPIYHEAEAARTAGFRNVVAPPMFCVVYSARAMGPAVLDPELAIDLARMVHGSQEFAWGEPVVAGDVITTQATVKDLYEKGGMEFYVWESESKNQEGQTTVKGTWTNIVRAG